MIATGRPLSGVPEEFQAGSLKASYFLTLNGAQIYDSTMESPLYLQGLHPSCLPLISSALCQQPALADFFSGASGYARKSQYQHASQYLASPHFLSYYLSSRTPLEDALWHQELLSGRSVEKCNLFFYTPEDKDAFRDALPPLPYTNICTGMDNNLELTHQNANKGTALGWLSHRLSIPFSKILAIGDSGNDRDMIRLAGTGVAMANANDSLKTIADYVTASNDQEGVSQALEKFILE